MTTPSKQGKTLCLTMIVKNETRVITRLFDSLYQYIDYWVIHDTGSTDGTPELIQKYFKEKDIPGELHHTPWKNFGYNRSLAIRSSQNKADYCLLFDADFILQVKDPNFKEKLGAADGYLLKYEGGLDYRQNLLVRSALNWEYIGVTHEYIHVKDYKYKTLPFDGITVNHRADGGCRSNKFERDIELLTQGIKDEPENGRYYFYLGQSHKDMGSTLKNQYEYKKRLKSEFAKRLTDDKTDDASKERMKEEIAKFEKEMEELEPKFNEHFEQAIPNYLARAKMGGWPEECYYSYLQIGLIKMRRGDNFWDFMGDLLKAYMFRPIRLEALFHLVRYCRLHNMAKLGFHLAEMAANNPYPKDLLFIDKAIHDWGFWDEYALCAHGVGKYDLAVKLGERILSEKKYGSRDEPRLKKNLEFYKSKISQVKPEVTTEVPWKEPEETKSTTPETKDVKKESVKEKEGEKPSKREFVRIDEDNKENRIAIIVANYNMPERANQIVEYIRNNVKWPCDVILVDNASDLTEPSQYTALQLAKNVQTCHAWLMGLNYADSLEAFEKFKYMAYSFVITSTEIMPDQGDIIKSLAQVLVDYPNVVGVHPSLTTDSTTHWKHMQNRKMGLRLTNMMDNIFSVYRADWFNSIGRFEPSMTYAWGIDMETCYFARRDGRKLVINDDIQVKKVTNIGYTMDRMNMSSGDRFKNARAQIEEYFTKKYGAKYNDVVSKAHRIPEFMPLNPALNDVIQGFTNREGGHRLLIEYLKDNHLQHESIFKNDDTKKINLLEIGCTREEWSHLNSSYKLAILAKTYGYQFLTIDADPEAIQKVTSMVNINENIQPINARAEEFLNDFDQDIHYVYLDGFDVNLGANHHSADRVRKYREYLKTEITNDKCYQMHLDCVRLLHKNLKVGGLICINDVINKDDFRYKGRTAIPFLLRTGCYRILDQKYNAILLERTHESRPVETKDEEECMLDLSRINLIREADLDDLQRREYLEETLIPSLGFNNELLHEQPQIVKANGGGLYIWQYPNQFSQYLLLLSRYNISSYLEIGCKFGGTFILTCEYLKRFNNFTNAMAVDILDVPVKHYTRREGYTYLQMNSTSQEFKDKMAVNEFDLVFIDGDHFYPGVHKDYMLLRDRGNIVVFHDIYSTPCEGVRRIWRELKENKFGDADQYEFHEFVDQYPEVMQNNNNQTFLGIGVAIKKSFAKKALKKPIQEEDLILSGTTGIMDNLVQIPDITKLDIPQVPMGNLRNIATEEAPNSHMEPVAPAVRPFRVDDREKYIVTLLGYTNEKAKHTNWYPWNRFNDVFRTMGYRSEWTTLKDLMPRSSESNPVPRIFICWNDPTCVELSKSGILTPNDVVIQKLTSLGKGMEGVNWGDNPKEYFSRWHWPIYQTVEKLLDDGMNIYAFGCKTTTKGFPEKERICNKLEAAGRLFWINWGSTMFSKAEIENCRPVTNNFEFDLGFVGSKWGQAGRGNTDQWNKYIQPVLDSDKVNKSGLYGSGQPKGMISDDEAKEVLRRSKICPIIHAPSWVAEEGIQDRFYSVFTAGRFGICDNPGVYEFFDKDEVVVETDPQKYIEKTLYFLEHPEKQIPYIEKVQHKIRTKYNLYKQWDDILSNIIGKQKSNEVSDHGYDFYRNLCQVHLIEKPFYEKPISS